MTNRNRFLHRLIGTIVASIFGISLIMPPSAYAQGVLSLPPPGAVIPLSNAFVPIVMKGIEIDPQDPFKFNFFIDTGETDLSEEALKEESRKLIKYFLASLTVPENDMWVNLSPYEKDRIIPEAFGLTEMGRDLLAQDYLLKQITASMMDPTKDLGETFWEKVYEIAYEKYGVSDIDVSTFNKVWIIPEKAVVYEHENRAFVVDQHLKVLVEEDYLALQSQMDPERSRKRNAAPEEDLPLATAIIKEVIIPELEKEVNRGEHFAPLRQIYHSMILATWFKRNLKESLLGEVYVGKEKIGGIDIEDKRAKQKIYEKYLEAFKIGVYDTIREEYDPVTQEIIARKYASGGIFGSRIEEVYEETAILSDEESSDMAMLVNENHLKQVSSTLDIKTAGSVQPLMNYGIYRGAQYVDGRIVGGNVLNSNGADDMIAFRRQLKEVPDNFSGIVRLIVPKTGKLKNILGQDIWSRWGEYASKPVVIVFKNGKVTDVFNANNEKIAPFNNYLIYPDANYKDGKTDIPEPVNPYGERLINGLNAYLRKNLHFSGVIRRVLLNNRGGLTNFHNKKVWWAALVGYENHPVTIIMRNGEVSEIYDEDANQIYPFKKNFVYLGADFVDGERVGGEPLTPVGLANREALNKLLREHKGFTGVITDVPLGETGGLTDLGEQRRLWPRMEGYENALVTIVMENGKVLSAHDKDGNEIYRRKEKKHHNIVYPGARFENGEIVGGEPINPDGTVNGYELNKIVGQDDNFTGVISRVPLDMSGGLTHFLREKVFGGMAGYAHALVTVTLENGKITGIYDKDNKKIYPFEDNFLYVNGRYENGKIIGEPLHAQGAQRRDYIRNYLLANPEFTGVIKTRLLSTGQVPKYIDDTLMGLWFGYENLPVIIVKDKGSTVGIFNEEGEQLFADPENTIYPDAKFVNGKIEGKALNPQRAQRRTFIVNYLRANPHFTGVIKTRLFSNGGIPKYIDANGWSSDENYKNMPVYVVKENGETTGIYDERGTKIFPNMENFIYPDARLVNGKIVGREQPVNPEGYTKRAMLGQYLSPNFSGIITKFRLSPYGKIGKINNKNYNFKIIGYENQVVSLRLENSLVVAVYNEAGDPVWACDREAVGAEILDNLWESGDFERLLDLFGEERTNRLVFYFFDNVTPLQLIIFTQTHFKKKLANDRKKQRKTEKKTPREVMNSLSKIDLFQRQPANVEFQSVLAHEIFSLIYFNISQDYRYLDRIQEEIESNQFNGLLRKALIEVVDTYKTLKDFKVNGIRTATRLKFYQKYGVRAILNDKRILLADKPGLGKTLQSLAAAVNAYDRKGAQKVFIVCPDVSIHNTWIKDIHKHLKGEQSIFVVNSRKDLDNPKKLERARNARFVIANYEVIRGPEAQALREKLKTLGIDFIIADEGHRMKNDSQITEAVDDFDAEYKVLVTASAQQGRSIGKIYNLLHWLYPERYRNRMEFLKAYNTTEGIKRLKSELKGFMVRRHITDVLSDLPDLNLEIYPVDLPPEQRELYQEVEKNFLSVVEANRNFGDGFGIFQNLVKAAVDTSSIMDISFVNPASGERYPVGAGMYTVNIDGVTCRISFKYPYMPTVLFTDNNGEKQTYPLDNGTVIDINGKQFEIVITERESFSAKYEATDNIVNDVVVNKAESLAIFSGSRKTVDALQKRYAQDHDVCVIHGSISTAQRKRILDRFNNSDKPMILISTYQTMGESVDITGARYGVLVDSPWLEREQIISRLYRLGQTNDVFFTILLAKNTIDEHIEKINWLNDTIKSIVLDDSFHIDSSDELAKDFIASSTQLEENFSQLKAFQERIRALQETNGTKSEAKNVFFTEYDDGLNRINFFNNQFDAELTLSNGLPVFISDFDSLLTHARHLSEGSTSALKDFFKERFQAEKKRNYRVKDMIFWQICNELIPGFRHIDYDGNLEFTVELGTQILRILMDNPGITEDELKTQLGDVPERIYNQTMHYLDTSNIFKLFSLAGVLPEEYYYNGNLLKYDHTIDTYYSNGRIRYYDDQAVENIAPEWEVKDSDIPEEIQGFDREARRVRSLTDIEQRRLANQVRLGNKSAEGVLVKHYMKNLKSIANRILYGGRLEKVFGAKISGTVTADQLVSFGQEELLDLLQKYADNEIYYNAALPDYLQKELNPHMYSEAFRIAYDLSSLYGHNDAYGDEGSPSATVLDMQGVDPVGTSRLEAREARDNFRALLSQADFSDQDIELLSLNVFLQYTEEDLAAEYAESLGQEVSTLHLQYAESLVDTFHNFMASFGREKAARLIENGFKKSNPDMAMSGDKERTATPVIKEKTQGVRPHTLVPDENEVGGIDLDPDQLEIEIRGRANETKEQNFNVTIFQSPAFIGFDPVIINITPVTNISAILGPASN